MAVGGTRVVGSGMRVGRPAGGSVVAAPAAPPRSGSSRAPGGGRQPRLRRQVVRSFRPTTIPPPTWPAASRLRRLRRPRRHDVAAVTALVQEGVADARSDEGLGTASGRVAAGIANSWNRVWLAAAGAVALERDN